jgi:major membrane immunogen (membrane-anchored lipoprotein)
MTSVVQEGAALNHCVASYVDGMVNGEYAIMFFRKKDAQEKSLVTLQIRDGRIVQARGQSNRTPSKEEQEAINKFFAETLEKQQELEMSDAA